LVIAAGSATGCARSSEAAPDRAQSSAIGAGSPAAAPLAAAASAAVAKDSQAPGAVSVNRKIVRQAELDLEVDSATNTQSSIEQLAERHGGYVVSATRDVSHESAIDTRVSVVIRVPADQLTNTLTDVKRLGRGIGSERVTSDDVTDEFIDVSARIVSQENLEHQYFDILKRAETVKDAMEVQKELAEVRTEIERLKGRQQLLDKESAFSTLTVHLTTAVPTVAISRVTFGGTLRRAFADSLAFSGDLITGAVTLLAYTLPLLFLIGIPSLLALWLMVRTVRFFARRSALADARKLAVAP